MRLSNGLLIPYSLPAIPLAMLLTSIIIYLPAFYSQTLGISLSSLGVVLFLCRLWDGLIDPIVGRASDKYRFRFGRRKTWLIAFAPLLMAGVYLVCQPPKGVGIIYVFFSLVFFYVAYTAVRIPYISWGAELSENYQERNRISGYREFGSMVGIFLSVAAPYFLLGGDNAPIGKIMQVFTWVLLVLLPLTVIVTSLTVKDISPAIRSEKSFWHECRVIAKNRPYMRILTAQAILFTGTYIYNACLVFLVENAMGLPGRFLSLILIEYIAMMLFVPVVIFLAGRFSKHHVMALGIFLQMGSHAIMAAMRPGEYWQAAAAFALIGFALASWYIIPTSLIADTVDYGKMRGGEDSAGFYMALFNFVDKASLAVAALIALPLLDWLGFKASGGNSAAALTSLRVVGAVLPLGIIFIAALVYWRYPLTGRKHGIVLRANARRLRAKG